MDFWSQLTQPQAALVAGLIGAFGAVAAGLTANVVGQLVGARGLGKRHWDQVRHLAYAELMEKFHAAWDMYDQRGHPVVGPGEEERRAAELMTAYAKTSLLTRRAETAQALEELCATAQQLWSRQGTPWPDTDRACFDAGRRFREAARRELGMPKSPAFTYEQHRVLYGLDAPAAVAGPPGDG